jgi:hypothetical protein
MEVCMDKLARTAHTARRSLGGVSPGVVLTFIVSLLAVSPLGSGAADAAGLQALSYSGTAEWTASGPADQLVPVRANGDLGALHMTSTWAIADRTHFRIETRTSSPPLETQTSVYAADGGTAAIWYRDIDAVALAMPLSPVGTPASEFLTGGALPFTSGSIGQYVDQYNHLGSGVHARLLAPQSYLGRTVDVVEVHPVSTGTTSSCSTNARGKQHCTEVTHGYGRERIWVDHEYPVILKVQVTGIPRQQGGNHTYQVTSITFGQQPTPSQLAFTSPVPVTDPGNSSASNASSGTTLGGTTGWQAPPGFVSAGAPTGPHGHPYTSGGSSETGQPGGQGIAGVSVIFGRGRTHTHGITANFVLIQERKRENGPPPLFASGTGRTAGTCRTVTGTFPDGLHWLGFVRQDIYVLVSSDSLAEGNLAQYVATAMCR